MDAHLSKQSRCRKHLEVDMCHGRGVDVLVVPHGPWQAGRPAAGGEFVGRSQLVAVAAEGQCHGARRVAAAQATAAPPAGGARGQMMSTLSFGPIRIDPPHVRYGVRRIGAPVEQLSDEALLAGFAAADPELATAFVQRFQAKVFGIAVHVVGDARTAEDVAQSAFERAWRHARAYDPRRGSVSGWLGVIARNLAIDTVRVRPVVAVDPGVLLSDYLGDSRAAPGPEQAAVDRESADELRDALRCLAPEHARAVVLAGIAGFSASQVAESEGIPLGTAKTRIRTGLLRLRSRLQEARTEHA